MSASDWYALWQKKKQDFHRTRTQSHGRGIAMVPGAGIEPARLAAGDFESPAISIFHAGFCSVCSAKGRHFGQEFQRDKVFCRTLFGSSVNLDAHQTADLKIKNKLAAGQLGVLKRS
ncbi:hypothetical protein [Polaromonas sp. YR568]|uniref:hypothetical protein n=1 Tax=Polaromonas sp. YR568 TaxID=1855301 RepID=UPI0015875DA2|nr:hypothetical protein [Polaromonas sp. YR568]